MPCTPKPDQITIDFTNYWKLFKGSHDMSIHVLWRLSTWSLEIPVTSSSVSPTPFLSLGQTVPQESKHNRSFQNLNQQLQTTQMMEPFDQLPIKKQKRLANHCMSFMSCQSISSVCHVAKLSFCYTLLIITMHHSKTSTEAPSSVGRASVGWQHGPSKTEPLSPSSTNMTVKLDPWTNPQANISKQALAYAFNRGMGDGNHASVTKLFSRSSCPKCFNIEINQPANQDRTKAPHAHHHPSSKLATVLKTETFLHKFHCSIGCSFLQPVWSVCTVRAAGRWIHRKPVADKLCQKIAEGEMSLWALGHWDKCFFHHPRGSKNICNVTSSYCQNWFHCFMFTQIQPGQIQRHWLSCPSVKWKQVCRSIICCPIFELQDWLMSTGASWLMMLLRDHPHWQIEELHGVFCNETFKTMTPRLSKPVCQDLALNGIELHRNSIVLSARSWQNSIWHDFAITSPCCKRKTSWLVALNFAVANLKFHEYM